MSEICRTCPMSETTQVPNLSTSDKVGNVDFSCLSVGDGERLLQ